MSTGRHLMMWRMFGLKCKKHCVLEVMPGDKKSLLQHLICDSRFTHAKHCTMYWQPYTYNGTIIMWTVSAESYKTAPITHLRLMGDTMQVANPVVWSAQLQRPKHSWRGMPNAWASSIHAAILAQQKRQLKPWPSRQSHRVVFQYTEPTQATLLGKQNRLSCLNVFRKQAFISILSPGRKKNPIGFRENFLFAHYQIPC